MRRVLPYSLDLRAARPRGPPAGRPGPGEPTEANRVVNPLSLVSTAAWRDGRARRTRPGPAGGSEPLGPPRPAGRLGPPSCPPQLGGRPQPPALPAKKEGLQTPRSPLSLRPSRARRTSGVRSAEATTTGQGPQPAGAEPIVPVPGGGRPTAEAHHQEAPFCGPHRHNLVRKAATAFISGANGSLWEMDSWVQENLRVKDRSHHRETTSGMALFATARAVRRGRRLRLHHGGAARSQLDAGPVIVTNRDRPRNGSHRRCRGRDARKIIGRFLDRAST